MVPAIRCLAFVPQNWNPECCVHSSHQEDFPHPERLSGGSIHARLALTYYAPASVFLARNMAVFPCSSVSYHREPP